MGNSVNSLRRILLWHKDFLFFRFGIWYKLPMLVVGLTGARGNENRQVVHGLDVALRGGALVPHLRTLSVGLYTEPTLIKRSKAELSQCEALRG